jgi:hypothetical protein
MVELDGHNRIFHVNLPFDSTLDLVAALATQLLRIGVRTAGTALKSAQGFRTVALPRY